MAAPSAEVVERKPGEEAPQVEEVAVETPVEGEEPPSEDREGVLKAFSELPGIGDATAQALWEAGFTSKAKLQGATKEELTKIKGLGPASAKKILSHLQESSG
ncbi:MAG: helix-hairpin-helix domain-containing protein [Thermoplasmata archaeon]